MVYDNVVSLRCDCNETGCDYTNYRLLVDLKELVRTAVRDQDEADNAEKGCLIKYTHILIYSYYTTYSINHCDPSFALLYEMYTSNEVHC